MPGTGLHYDPPTEPTKQDTIPYTYGKGADIVVSPNPDDVLRFWVLGDRYPRLVVDPGNHRVLLGNGQIAPDSITTGGVDISNQVQAAVAAGVAASNAYSDLQNGVTLQQAKDYTDAAIATALAGSGTPQTVPGAPTIGVGTPTGTQVSVTFTAPGSDGGNTIIDYTVTATPNGGGQALTATGAASPIVVTGLTPGTVYTAKVTARNGIGSSAASAASANFTCPAVVPGVPTIGAASAGDATASVSFTAPASNGGSAITGYTVTFTSSDGGTTRTGTGATSPIAPSAALTNGKTYTATVHATNAVGSSAESAATSAFFPAVGGGAAPAAQALSVIAANEHIFGSFAAPATGTPIRYVVSVAVAGAQYVVPDMTITATGQAREKFIIDNIRLTKMGGAAVTVSVVAVTSLGTSAPISTTSLTVDVLSPLQTFTVDGDRISGIWLNATVRDTIGSLNEGIIHKASGAAGVTTTDHVITTLTVDATNAYAANVNVVGRSLNGTLTCSSGVTVSFIGCKITKTANGTSNFTHSTGAGGQKMRFRYCEGDGLSAGGVGVDAYGATVAYGQGMTYWTGWVAVGCYVHHCVHPYYSSGNNVLKWSSADNCAGTSNDHVDGLFMDQGTIPDIIVGNHLANENGQTASQVWCSFGGTGAALTGPYARDNILDGGGYAMYWGSKVGNTTTTQDLQNNRWKRSYRVAAAYTIPAGSGNTLTVNRSLSPAQGVTMPSSGIVLVGCDDGTWARGTFTGKNGSVLSGVAFTTQVGKVATPSNVVTGNNNQGTVRILDTATGVNISGLWGRGGYFGSDSAPQGATGTNYYHANVWDDDGTNISNGLNGTLPGTTVRGAPDKIAAPSGTTFTAADVGKHVAGPGVAGSPTIASVQNAGLTDGTSTATLSTSNTVTDAQTGTFTLT